MSDKKETVLVAGGAGFIGSHVVDRLMARGYRIKVIDQFSSGKTINIAAHVDNERFELIEGDLMDRALVGEVVKGVDAVINMSGRGNLSKSIEDPNGYHDINVTANLNLLTACKEHRVKKFVFASSGSVYKAEISTKIKETEDYGPESPYAANKVCSEIYCKIFRKVYGMETVILRFFNVYGPRRENSTYSGAVTQFMMSLIEGKPVTVTGDGTDQRDYVYVKDIAKGIHLSLKPGVSGEFNIATGVGTSTNDMLKAIEKVVKKKAKVVHAPKRPGDTPYRVADISRAMEVLGYSPEYSLDKGLSELKDYLNDVLGVGK